MRNLCFTLALIFLTGSLSVTHAQESNIDDACEARAPMAVGSGEFTKKRYSIAGNWTLQKDCTGHQLSFTEDFKTKGGPDLKVYLSKLPISELGSKTVDGNSVKLSVLKSAKGQQNYSIPLDTNLSEYKSVIIHCEAFSVLWGGFDLPE